MKRLFTFGCSYTHYSWATYADFLGVDFDHYENWGLSGIGNRAIAERVAECNVKNKLEKTDTVIIQWSSHIRNDFYHMTSLKHRLNGWKTYGSIFNYHNAELYDREWIETFFFEPAYLMHTLNNIQLVQGLLDAVGCNWYMTSIGDFKYLGSDMRDKDKYGEKTNFAKKLAESKKTAWDAIPDLKIYQKLWDDRQDKWLMPLELFCQTCPDSTYEFLDLDGSTFIDLHPSPQQHLNWIQQELKEKLNLSDLFFEKNQKIVDQFNKKQQKFKNNKIAFEYDISHSKDFELHAWPNKPVGF